MFNESLQVKQPRWDDCKRILTDDITKIFHLLVSGMLLLFVVFVVYCYLVYLFREIPR